MKILGTRIQVPNTPVHHALHVSEFTFRPEARLPLSGGDPDRTGAATRPPSSRAEWQDFRPFIAHINIINSSSWSRSIMEHRRYLAMWDRAGGCDPWVLTTAALHNDSSSGRYMACIETGGAARVDVQAPANRSTWVLHRPPPVSGDSDAWTHRHCQLLASGTSDPLQVN
jgi:hypothetical protein